MLFNLIMVAIVFILPMALVLWSAYKEEDNNDQ